MPAVRLHFTYGGTEAQISVWPEAVQGEVVEIGSKSWWPDWSLGPLSTPLSQNWLVCLQD